MVYTYKTDKENVCFVRMFRLKSTGRMGVGP